MNKKTDEKAGAQEQNKVHDKSNDRLYFTITPRLVWALSETPYEYTLWGVIKDIAGEDGQCIITREDMAILAMMSSGMASKCRDNLISKGLLLGEFVRDPGYPQSVWHLTIPDFWEANVRWARRYLKLKDRIEFKRQQKAFRELKDASPGDASKDASPGDDSNAASPGDRGGAPGDGGVPPGDGKNIVLEDPLEKIWNVLFENLETEMIREKNREGFDKYVRDARPVSIDPDGWLNVAVKDESTLEWVQDRLTTTIDRLLIGLVPDRDVRVKFVIPIEEPV